VQHHLQLEGAVALVAELDAAAGQAPGTAPPSSTTRRLITRTALCAGGRDAGPAEIPLACGGSRGAGGCAARDGANDRVDHALPADIGERDLDFVAAGPMRM
jgi:hypothetical protein